MLVFWGRCHGGLKSLSYLSVCFFFLFIFIFTTGYLFDCYRFLFILPAQILICPKGIWMLPVVSGLWVYSGRILVFSVQIWGGGLVPSPCPPFALISRFWIPIVLISAHLAILGSLDIGRSEGVKPERLWIVVLTLRPAISSFLYGIRSTV